jgi:RNA polymerase sigma-70 factor, ECF subfamily
MIHVGRLIADLTMSLGAGGCQTPGIAYCGPRPFAVLETATKASTGPLTGIGQRGTGLDGLVGDVEDIRLARQGDSDAYRRLVERHQNHVAKILWRFSRDRLIHEELVQDVFVEAYLSLSGYRGKAPFGHWLARISTRVGYRYWKEKARQKATEPFSIEEWDGVADETESLEKLDPEQAAGIVHQVLEQLPPRDRLVLVLRYLEGCDVAETARRTGWTKAMVKVQALRARSKLKRLLERHETELIE